MMIPKLTSVELEHVPAVQIQRYHLSVVLVDARFLRHLDHRGRFCHGRLWLHYRVQACDHRHPVLDPLLVVGSAWWLAQR
jgi:hypothetical protein